MGTVPVPQHDTDVTVKKIMSQKEIACTSDIFGIDNYPQYLVKSSTLETIHVFKEREESNWKSFLAKCFKVTEITPTPPPQEDTEEDDDLFAVELEETAADATPDVLTQTQADE